MDLNGITCEDYDPKGNRFTAILVDTDISKISELDNQTLCITKSDTDKTYFGGYTVMGVDYYGGNRYLVRFLKHVSDLTEQAIDALEKNVEQLDTRLGNTETESISTKNDISNLMSVAEYSVMGFASKITDSEMVAVASFIPDWKTGKDYKTGDFLVYDNRYFRVSQDHESQEIWLPGSEGTEALYYEIVIAPDGIIVWSAPSGAYNTPNKGDLRHYPNADSPIYKSLIDGNAYSPDTYPAGWEIQE